MPDEPTGALSATAAASVLRAAADSGVPVEAPPRSAAEFDRLWAAARITAPDSEVDDEMWLAREQLKAYILAHGLTGGWLEDIVFGPAVTLVRTVTPVRDAPRRRRRWPSRAGSPRCASTATWRGSASTDTGCG